MMLKDASPCLFHLHDGYAAAAGAVHDALCAWSRAGSSHFDGLPFGVFADTADAVGVALLPPAEASWSSPGRGAMRCVWVRSAGQSGAVSGVWEGGWCGADRLKGVAKFEMRNSKFESM